MNRKDYYQAVLLGVVIGIVSLCLVGLLSSIIDVKPAEDVKPAKTLEPLGNFKVMSKYKGCDLVKWQTSAFSNQEYFLYCGDK